MMKRNLFIISLFSLFSLSAVLYADPSAMTELHCTLVGHADARAEYRAQLHEALKAFGVEGAGNVVVKKMNRIAKRTPYSSFTLWGGVWLNEEIFDTYPDSEKTFRLYHEAAHYAAKHYHRTAGLCVGTLIIALGASTKKTVGRIISLCSFASLLGTVPWLTKKQEKDADIRAAKKLVEVGKQHIVEDYIALLKKSSLRPTSFFFYSDEDRIAYLEKAVGIRAAGNLTK